MVQRSAHKRVIERLLLCVSFLSLQLATGNHGMKDLKVFRDQVIIGIHETSPVGQ
ncbi:hypothetical protein KAM375_44260 [Aeromonas caviae]|nr:hypothetical protein KAM375_44260 [Aeromonas caviae]